MDMAGVGGPFGMGMRGGGAWIGILVALFALRFLLVGSIVGVHAAIYWVLVIGGIVLVARVVLFSWLRRRRFNRRRIGRAAERSTRHLSARTVRRCGNQGGSFAHRPPGDLEVADCLIGRCTELADREGELLCCVGQKGVLLFGVECPWLR